MIALIENKTLCYSLNEITVEKKINEQFRTQENKNVESRFDTSISSTYGDRLLTEVSLCLIKKGKDSFP